MEKFSNFFERILQIIEYYNIRSINDFAKNYLGYASSEKINRLKDPSKNPSFEILQDISNRFEEISPDWLLMGNGEMLRNSPKITVNGDKNFANNGQLINSHIDYRDIHSDSPDVLRAQIDVLDERIREKDAQIREKDAQIREKDAQIKELLNIISQMSKKG